jgi:hypothetical protein
LIHVRNAILEHDPAETGLLVRPQGRSAEATDDPRLLSSVAGVLAKSDI